MSLLNRAARAPCQRVTSPPCPCLMSPRPGAAHSRARVVAAASIGDFFRDLFDYESWAPRSARAWRLRQKPTNLVGNKTDEQEEKSPGNDVELRMREQLAEAQQRASSSARAQMEAAAPAAPASAPSFDQADDTDVMKGLNARIAEIAKSGDAGANLTEEEMRQRLTGGELRELIYAKYGKTYDMSFVRRDFAGKSLIYLNVMWTHLEQRSFQMTEAEYMEKLDAIASMLEVLPGSSSKVRSFLKSPMKSQRGLPRRPTTGTAIPIQLDVDKAIADEFFASGYQ